MESRKILVEVKSVVRLSDKDKISVEKLVGEIADDFVTISYRVEPKLLGGLTIQIGDRKIDASLRQELSQLRKQLKGNNYGS